MYPKTDVSEKLNRSVLAKGVLATTAIEGNTMTEEEVEKFLSGELKLPASREYLGQEISNVAEECNRIVDLVSHGAQPILNRARIEELNRTVLRNLTLAEGVIPGKFVITRWRCSLQRRTAEIASSFWIVCAHGQTQ